MLGGRQPIVAPPAAPPRLGLLPTFRAIEGGDVPWEHGIAFSPEQCAPAGRAAVACATPGASKAIPANPANVEANPFYVWASDKCSAMDQSRDRQGRADRMLAASESFEVANELWTGAVAQASTEPDGVTPWPNRFLASPDADVLNPVGDPPFTAINALGCLEYALGQCQNGGRGVIHATKQLATEWARFGMLRREGSYLLTALDTFVVADAGYDGSGPAGQGEAENSQWAYATGLPIIYLGPVSHEETSPLGVREFNSLDAQRFDPDINLIEVRAEREALVTWDGCCHLAVEVDLPLCYVGGAS